MISWPSSSLEWVWARSSVFLLAYASTSFSESILALMPSWFGFIGFSPKDSLRISLKSVGVKLRPSLRLVCVALIKICNISAFSFFE